MNNLNVLKWILIALLAVLTLGLVSCQSKNYETNEHEITSSFSNISINAKEADISFVRSDDGLCKVTCYEHKKEKHAVKISGDTLTIEIVDEKKWYEHIAINTESPKIVIALPEAQYGLLNVKSSTGDITVVRGLGFESIDLSLTTGDVNCYASAKGGVSIDLTTGDINLEGLSAGLIKLESTTGDVKLSNVSVSEEVTLEVSTGEVTLERVSCRSLTSNGTTGSIALKNVIATGTISIDTTTGDVNFVNSDAGELYIKVTTGDVEGNLLTDKVFITKTNTGDVSVPASIIGGRCEITTTTGNISITVSNN